MSAASARVRLSASESLSARTFRNFVRTFGLAERVMNEHFARFGISGAQWGVLRNLQRAADEGVKAIRMTDLSERLLIRPPSVTGVVDRLERIGLVERMESQTDQRSKLVGLTNAGRQLVRRVLAVHEKKIESVLSEFAPKELAALHHYHSRLGQHLEKLLGRHSQAVVRSG